MKRTPFSPCIAQIAFSYEGAVDTVSNFGKRKTLSAQKLAYLYCRDCSIDNEFPILSEADVEVFLTKNCMKNPQGEDIMIK